MKFLNILQLVGLVPSIIQQIEQTREEKPGKVKREEVKEIALSSFGIADQLSKMNITDRKKFNKGLDKVIDGIVEMLNASEWK